MQLGMVGLGGMVGNMVRRLLTLRGEADFQDRLFSLMRYGFGGHLKKANEKKAQRLGDLG
jgi:6-phosphogluconate dehydrogenase (decarboxylating)